MLNFMEKKTKNKKPSYHCTMVKEILPKYRMDGRGVHIFFPQKCFLFSQGYLVFCFFSLNFIVISVLFLDIQALLFFHHAGQPLWAVQHQLRQREAPGVLQQAHLLAGAAGIQQVTWLESPPPRPQRSLFSSARVELQLRPLNDAVLFLCVFISASLCAFALAGRASSGRPLTGWTTLSVWISSRRYLTFDLRDLGRPGWNIIRNQKCSSVIEDQILSVGQQLHWSAVKNFKGIQYNSAFKWTPGFSFESGCHSRSTSLSTVVNCRMYLVDSKCNNRNRIFSFSCRRMCFWNECILRVQKGLDHTKGIFDQSSPES